MNESEVVLIKTDPLRLVWSLFVSGLGVAVCVFFVVGPGWIFSATCILLAALWCFVLVAGVVTGQPSIELTDRGIIARPLFGERRYEWADIDGEFAVHRRLWMSMIVFRLTPDAKNRLGKLPSPAPGYDAGITGSYRLSMPALAALLNRRRSAIAPGSETRPTDV
jgi:hypothetical protein